MFVEHKSPGEASPNRENVHEGLDEPAKLLMKAADLIEKHGWCQGRWRATDGRLCLRGAIINSGSHQVAFAAIHRVDAAIGGPYTSVGWNDTMGRTKEEVVAKLRSVALGG
jgi:hypothetical protein